MFYVFLQATLQWFEEANGAINQAKFTFKLTNSAERCDWFKLMHVIPYFCQCDQVKKDHNIFLF